MTDAGPIHMNTRTLIHMQVDPGNEDAYVEVEHVYAPEGQAGVCRHADCDRPAHDPGLVGLTVKDPDEMAGVLLFPEQALILANRLTRAANLIMESDEDVPDVEREAARFAAERGEG